MPLTEKDLKNGLKVRLKKPTGGCCKNGCNTEPGAHYGWDKSLDRFDGQIVTVTDLPNGVWFRAEEAKALGSYFWVHYKWAEFAETPETPASFSNELNTAYFPKEVTFSPHRSCTGCGGYGKHRLMCKVVVRT